MSDRQIVFPNSIDSFIIDEMCQRLAEGLTVRISFGGRSMLPLIDGCTDIILLEPLSGEIRVGDVFLFRFNGRCVIHRLLRVDGDIFVFRGDNCMNKERVRRKDVVARLKAVEHGDGTVDDCDSSSWRRRSRRVALRRSVINAFRRLLSRHNRRWMRWLYFALLLVLMWAPMGFVGVPLNNFVFGIRLDHLLHASVYLPSAFFLMDFFSNSSRGRRPRVAVWAVGASLGVVTETVQYLLPYRGFDINDLVANFLGVTLGWIIIGLLKK